MSPRMQPRNEKFFTLFSKASSNAVESAAILMEFAAAAHERWAKLAKRMLHTEHAGDDTTQVVDPEQGGCQDEGAAVDTRVGVLSPAIISVIAPEDRVLGSLLVHENDIHHHLGVTGPRERGWIAPIADQIPLPNTLGDHAITVGAEPAQR